MAGEFRCENIDLVGHVSHEELGTTVLNDMWGWTDPESGEDYALVGSRTGTAFVNITNPASPEVYGFLPTASSQGGDVWRDIKVYENYAYIVSEHDDHGVQVFDLTRLRDWNGTYTTYDVDNLYTGHGSAHNIFINEDTGFAYSVGAGPTSDQRPYEVRVDGGPTYLASGAAFGPAPGDPPETGDFILTDDGVVDTNSDTTTDACTELTQTLDGEIAIALRGSCAFTVKAANAQAAGASALIVVNSGPGSFDMAGADDTITIPSVMVSQGDGEAIINSLPQSGEIGLNSNSALCGNGLHMIDLADPANPTFGGCFQTHDYVHDTQCVIYDGPDAEHVGKEICFNSNGIEYAAMGENYLSIVDVTDKLNPIALARIPYDTSGYSHQGWLTEDHTRFIHNDEGDEVLGTVQETSTRVFDVTDLDNPSVESTFNNGEVSIDHNMYTQGRYVYAANYTSGLRVFDLIELGTPGGELSEVAWFDTFPDDDANPVTEFGGGLWSNYPYFAQRGLIGVSSQDRGLFLLAPNLEDVVTVEATVETADAETDGEFTLTRAQSAIEALTVEYQLGGTAAIGEDYVEPTGTITFDAGETEASLPIEVLDAIEEDGTVELTVIAGDDYIPGDPASATVTLQAGDQASVTELEADDNVARSIELSQLVFPPDSDTPTDTDGRFAQEDDTSTDTVLIGRDNLFADSLSSGGAQGVLGAPLLLTPGEGLDDRVADEIERLGAERAILLGGVDALSEEVADDLEDVVDTVDRVEGPTRLETAVAVADELVDTSSDTAILARAYPADDGEPTQAFADALAAGAHAADVQLPLLLTQTDVLSTSTSEWLESNDIANVVVIGGNLAISDEVVTDLEDLGITVTRVGGESRAETAVSIAAARGAATAADADSSLLVDGANADAWADAFPAALFASQQLTPIVLVSGDTVPPETETYLTDGGTPLVCASLTTEAACEAAADLLGIDS